MWRVYRRSRKGKYYTNYKEALNLATTEIRKSKRTFEQELAGNIKNDSKSFYAYVRSKQKARGKVGPLFKKGSRNKPENYRPVSLTSVVCKLLETLIRDHVVEFLVKHKLINTSQHGFLKARSCLSNLLCFLEEITKWVDDGSPVDVVYLDFQKA